MSVKIYYGYRVKMQYLPYLIRQANKKLLAEYERQYKELFLATAEAIVVHVQPRAKQSGSNQIHILEAVEQLMERLKTNDAIKCSYVVMFSELLEGYALVNLYASNNYYTEVFSSLDYIEEFGYWNNTDHPEELTRDQWQQRGQIWKDAMSDYSLTAAEAGLSFDVADCRFFRPVHVSNIKDLQSEITEDKYPVLGSPVMVLEIKDIYLNYQEFHDYLDPVQS